MSSTSVFASHWQERLTHVQRHVQSRPAKLCGKYGGIQHDMLSAAGSWLLLLLLLLLPLPLLMPICFLAADKRPARRQHFVEEGRQVRGHLVHFYQRDWCFKFCVLLGPAPVSLPTLTISIVHIDFGWMLGKVMPMNIEASAPFKLTADMAAVMRCGSNTLGYQVICFLPPCLPFKLSTVFPCRCLLDTSRPIMTPPGGLKRFRPCATP